MSDTSLYNSAKALMAEYIEWAEQGFPGATLEDLVEMTSKQPELDAEAARNRADLACGLLLAGAWEVRADLDEKGITDPELRLALYKSRRTAKKGQDAYRLFDVAGGDL